MNDCDRDEPGLTRRVFWVTYHASEREARPAIRNPSPYGRLLHEVRDGLAFVELWMRLADQKYTYAGPLLNLPDAGFPSEIDAEPLPKILPTDLLVLATRPPLDDPQPPKKHRHTKAGSRLGGLPLPLGEDRSRKILQSKTALEADIFCVIRECFLTHCSREQVILQGTLAEVLPPHLRNRNNIEFTPKGGASYASHWPAEEPNSLAGRTAGYLLFTPHAWINGPSLLAIFGMAGIETFALAHWLAGEPAALKRILGSRSDMWFVLAEWHTVASPRRPVFLGFLDCSPDILCAARRPLGREQCWSPAKLLWSKARA